MEVKLNEILEQLTMKTGAQSEIDEQARLEWEKMAKVADRNELKILCINYNPIVSKIKSNHLKIAG